MSFLQFSIRKLLRKGTQNWKKTIFQIKFSKQSWKKSIFQIKFLMITIKAYINDNSILCIHHRQFHIRDWFSNDYCWTILTKIDRNRTAYSFYYEKCYGEWNGWKKTNTHFSDCAIELFFFNLKKLSDGLSRSEYDTGALHRPVCLAVGHTNSDRDAEYRALLQFYCIVRDHSRRVKSGSQSRRLHFHFKGLRSGGDVDKLGAVHPVGGGG